MKQNKNNKITKYRRYSFLNIGTLMFGVVFLYMVVFVVGYLMEEHVTPYEVIRGNISGNYRYQALALRTEQIVTAERSGYLTYYAREGYKTSAGSLVCAINESGEDTTVRYEDFEPDEDELARIRSVLSSFTMNYSGTYYQKTYAIKDTMHGILSEITREQNEENVLYQNRCSAPESGFVLYGIDGFESMTAQDLTKEVFDQNQYKLNYLRGSKKAEVGQELYKLVTQEEWKLYFPLDEKLSLDLEGVSTIRFRFLKDNQTFQAPFTIVRNGTEQFGEISMDNSLIRYVQDRFLEIELVLNKKDGLKIPASAIVEKQFYQIPEDYAIVNEDTTQEVTLLVEHFRENGSSENKYHTANVYQHKDGVYYINADLLEDGDFVVNAESGKRFEITESARVTLYGVYNINKGYAVFREVTVIDRNEEYCVVESNNIYGLAAYDYIILDASAAHADQIIN